MASRTIVSLIDDLDGKSEATETRVIAYEGSTYEVDLTAEHAQQYDLAVQRFAEAGRRVSGAGKRHLTVAKTPVTNSEEKARNRAIRAWADSQHISVSARGRISNEVVEQYDAAMESGVEKAATPKPAPPRRPTVAQQLPGATPIGVEKKATKRASRSASAAFRSAAGS